MVRIDRYMLSQLLILFGFFALVLVAVLWVNRGVSLFEQLISDGQSALVFLEFTALGLPKLITTVLPIATFAATVYVTNRMNNESELVVLQATGSGPFRMARPVFYFSVIVFLISSVLHHFLLPLSEEQLEHRQNQITQNATAQLLTEGRFLHPAWGVTFYTRKIDEDGLLRDVFLSDRRRDDEGVIYTAQRAYLIRTPENTSIIMLDGIAQRLTYETNQLATANFRDFSFDISSLLQKKTTDRIDPDKMTTLDMLQTPWEEIAEELRRGMGGVVQSFHTRFADPLFSGIAALIGFSTLLIGGYSRFGVWREVAIAFGILVALDGIRGTVQNPVNKDPTLWPLIYAPIAFSFLLIAIFLWIAARPRGGFWRFRRSAA